MPNIITDVSPDGNTARCSFERSPAEVKRFEEARAQKRFIGVPVSFEISNRIDEQTRIDEKRMLVRGFHFELQFEDGKTGDEDFMRGAVVFEQLPPSPEAVTKAFRRLAEECERPFDSEHIVVGEQELTGREIRI